MGHFGLGKFLGKKMNLIAEIAEGIAQGWSHAKIAVEVELKHGVQVGEAWIARITGADGFAQALTEARARLLFEALGSPRPPLNLPPT